MKKINNIKNEKLFKMYGGNGITDSIDNLNNQLKTTIDENIFFTKTIIDEIQKLTTINSNFDDKSKGHFGDLNVKLQEILKNIVDFKDKYETDIANKELNSYDEYINQVNTIQSFIAGTFNEDSLNNYLTLKLSEQPVFIKEQIDVIKITKPIEETIKIVINDINLLEENIKTNTDASQVKIETEIKNIAMFLGKIDTEIKKLKEITKKIKLLNIEYEKYINITLEKKDMDELIFVAQECIDKDMIVFSNIGSSQIENQKNVDNFNLLQEINNKDLGQYLTDATILSNIIQKGGSKKISNTLNESIDNYYDSLTSVNNKINEIKEILNEFKKISMNYNIYYIQVYNHLLFVVNYLKLIIMNQNSNYLIYQYLGRGTTTYYLRIIIRILNDIENKHTSLIGKYFYKYHYINIQILKNFLEFLNKYWKEYDNNCIINSKSVLPDSKKKTNEQKKVLSKMYLLCTGNNPIIKKCIFIFNSMKDILDKYYSEFSPPVGIYLRINDWTKHSKDDIIFAKDENNKLGFIDKTSLKKCTDDAGKLKSNDVDINKASQVKFQEVFDPDGFDSNEVLAKYMAIPSFLQDGKSIMLITYGYSGVGKTFTIFGSRDPYVDGVLQSSLSNIQQKKSLHYRAYEIYGLAVPYKIYWDRNEDEYYHFLYDYTDINNIITYDSKKMNEYLLELLEPRDNGTTTFKELSDDLLKNFSNIVASIDEKRKTKGTIKRTINNRESSRSIMIYDFKIELNDGKFVYFVVMDLPGKEHIEETFIKEPPKNEYTCIRIKNNYGVDNELLKKMAYCSPLALALDVNLANLIIKEYNAAKFDLTINYVGVVNEPTHQSYQNNLDKIKKSESGSRIYAIEIMRNIIQLNKFDLLKSIYNHIFDFPPDQDNNYKSDEKYKCSTHESYAITPFEGYYINENITGIITTLLKKLQLNNNFIESQNYVYEKLFTELVFNDYYTKFTLPDKEKIRDDNKNLKELIAQTYFFRKFVYDNPKLHNSITSWYNNTEKIHHGHNFKYWFSDEDIYNYNKAYRKDNPPIAKILNPYFNIIQNFFVFYVVSNENKDKCEKQIKFIADSFDFLTELNRFDPEVYKKSMKK